MSVLSYEYEPTVRVITLVLYRLHTIRIALTLHNTFEPVTKRG